MSATAQKPDRFADYVSVAERIDKFYSQHGEGKILTTVVEHDREAGFILMRAEVYRSKDDAMPSATGHAFEMRSEGFVNKTSYVENCETGAVGRALANLGLEVKRGIASREEMQKAERMSARPSPEQARQQTEPSAPIDEEHDKIDQDIRQAFIKKGHTINELRPMINKRYEVEDGLNSLSIPLKKELLAKLKTP